MFTASDAVALRSGGRGGGVRALPEVSDLSSFIVSVA